MNKLYRITMRKVEDFCARQYDDFIWNGEGGEEEGKGEFLPVEDFGDSEFANIEHECYYNNSIDARETYAAAIEWCHEQGLHCEVSLEESCAENLNHDWSWTMIEQTSVEQESD